jgi:hypothetical protein
LATQLLSRLSPKRGLQPLVNRRLLVVDDKVRRTSNLTLSALHYVVWFLPRGKQIFTSLG